MEKKELNENKLKSNTKKVFGRKNNLKKECDSDKKLVYISLQEISSAEQIVSLVTNQICLAESKSAKVADGVLKCISKNEKISKNRLISIALAARDVVPFLLEKQVEEQKKNLILIFYYFDKIYCIL